VIGAGFLATTRSTAPEEPNVYSQNNTIEKPAPLGAECFIFRS
jgi:hypothetical protein